MAPLLFFSALLFPAWLAVAAGAADTPAAAEDTSGRHVVICPIEGEINPGVAIVVERAVKEAANADLLVFVVNTPGGRVDSAIEITTAIVGAKCRTVAYLEGMGAISAGAMISFACDDIIMGPATEIGASTPFIPGVEMSEDVQEKSYSVVRKKFRALAEENGHNPLLGEAMVDPDIELHGRLEEDGKYMVYRVEDNKVRDSESANPPKEKDAIDAIIDTLEDETNVPLDEVKRALREAMNQPAPADEPEEASKTTKRKKGRPDGLPDGTELICASGKLLTLSTNEALKYGLAKSTADDLEAVLRDYEAAGLPRIQIVPGWDEDLYAWLTSPLISGLLLMCAMGGIYLEVRTPGFGLPGIIGITCLAVFLGSHYVIGLAEWEDVLLIGIGLGLVVIEVFWLPGFGFAGVAGILCLIAGLYLSLVRVPIPEFGWDFQNLEDAGKTVTLALGLFLLFAIATWKLLPASPIFRWMSLPNSQQVSEGYVIQTQEDVTAALGQHGQTSSVLRPAGKGRFGGKTYDIVSRGEFIEPGTPVKIIGAEGNRYVVAALNDESPPNAGKGKYL